MAGVTPLNFSFGAGVYPIKYGSFAGECFEDFYYFDPAKPSNLTLDAPFTGVLTLLFSTFQGAQGLPSEFANETVTNAPIGAKSDSSLYAGTGNQITKTVTNLTQVIAANFDGVLWAYALDGVWYYVNQGGEGVVTRQYYQLDGIGSYIVQVANINLTPSTPVSLMFRRFAKVSQYERFFGSTDFALSLDTGINGDKFRLIGGTATLDGSPIVSDVTTIPTDDAPHEIIFTPTLSSSITRFGDVSGGGTSRKIKATLYDIKVGDGSLHHYPVNDGPSAGGVVTNLGSAGNASLVNEIVGDWYEL